MNDMMIRLLYGNAVGRWLLCVALRLGLPKLMARYLNSRFSRRLIPKYIKKHQISMESYPARNYQSFAEFFSRKRRYQTVDPEPTHFSSPCDGWLSCCEIHADSSFQIKGSHYRIIDLVGGDAVAGEFDGGQCLIFRLTAADYHRYSFPDDGYVARHHYIEGLLHSVQPIACETFPVFRLNRRSWTVLNTDHFGKMIQVEIGALAVGGIVNEKQNTVFRKGEEMGHFTLCGSTIVLLIQKNRLELLPEIEYANAAGREYRVSQGDWIGNQPGAASEEQSECPKKFIFFSSEDTGI